MMRRLAEFYPNAIVTGGSRGIGKALARDLAMAGVKTHLIAKSLDRLTQTAGELSALTGSDIGFTATDLSRPTCTEDIANACGRLGAPNLLICGAAIGGVGLTSETAPETFEDLLHANFTSAVRTFQTVLPYMREAKGERRILFVSSGAGLIGVYGYGAYGVSKFALAGLAETLRAELRGEGIGVSIAFPPNTQTDLYAYSQTHAPPGALAITNMARTFSPEAVSASILRGLLRRRFEISPGYEMTLLRLFRSFAKPVIFRSWDRAVDREKAKG